MFRQQSASVSASRAGLVVVLAALLLALFAGPANAEGCYGDWCSGKDPAATGCAKDASTVAYVHVHYQTTANLFRQNEYAGLLELRWSPSCQTNWARFSPQDSFEYKAGAVQPMTGYDSGWTEASPWETEWSKQIYSPRECVYALVEIEEVGINEPRRTACI